MPQTSHIITVTPTSQAYTIPLSEQDNFLRPHPKTLAHTTNPKQYNPMA